jgi:hypothetical protein
MNTTKNLVVCGDSFSIGIGCRNLKTEPYGSLLADRLNLNLINYAKGSSTNFSIYLQVKYAIENVKDIELLIVAPTCHYRTEFFTKEVQYNPKKTPQIDNTCVNYHQYPPYGKDTYLPDQILENPMANDIRYNPVMYTENYHGIFDYLKLVENGIQSGYYDRYKNEDINRIKTVAEHCVDITHASIQKWYDIGMINMAQTLLINNSIPYLIIDNDAEMLEIVPDKNKCYISWGDLSTKYPDDIPTSHTSVKGHLEVYTTILNKLKQHLI